MIEVSYCKLYIYLHPGCGLQEMIFYAGISFVVISSQYASFSTKLK